MLNKCINCALKQIPGKILQPRLGRTKYKNNSGESINVVKLIVKLNDNDGLNHSIILKKGFPKL